MYPVELVIDLWSGIGGILNKKQEATEVLRSKKQIKRTEVKRFSQLILCSIGTRWRSYFLRK